MTGDRLAIPVNTIRAVMFDLDGTLVATGGEIAGALNQALADLRLPPLSLAVVETLIGKGVHSMVARALARVGAPAERDACIARFEKYYAVAIGTGATLYPGVLPGLQILDAAGYKLGVVTNKPRLFTEQLLSCLAIDTFMSVVVAGDDGWPRKPQGDMLQAACRAVGTTAANTLMIGDSVNDVLAARAAGCPVWCVPYGYNEGRPADTLLCDRMVADVLAAAQHLHTPAADK